jgi:tetratricopeptide (TPR) repeat protein
LGNRRFSDASCHGVLVVTRFDLREGGRRLGWIIMERYWLSCLMVCCYLISVLGAVAGEQRMDVESNLRFENEILPLLEKGTDNHFRMLLWNRMGEQYAYWGEPELAQKYYQKADKVYDRLLKGKGDPAADLAEPFVEYMRFVEEGYFRRDHDRVVAKLAHIKNPQKRKKQYSRLLNEVLRHEGEEEALRVYRQHKEALGEDSDMEIRIAMKEGNFDRMRSILKEDACCRLALFVREYSNTASVEENRRLLNWLERAEPDADDGKKRLKWLSAKVSLYQRLGEVEKIDAALAEVEEWVFSHPDEDLYEQSSRIMALYQAYTETGRQEQAERVFVILLDFLKNERDEYGGNGGALTAMATLRTNGELARMEQLMDAIPQEVFTWPTAILLLVDEAMRKNRKDVALPWVEKFARMVKEGDKGVSLILDMEVAERWIQVGEYRRAIPAWNSIRLPEIKEELFPDLVVVLWAHQQYTDESIHQGILQALNARPTKAQKFLKHLLRSE